jgi:hypothetical protein
MSLSYEINVICDTEECDEIITTEPVDKDQAGEAISETILYHRWIVRDGKHYCPTCAAAKAQEFLTTIL